MLKTLINPKLLLVIALSMGILLVGACGGDDDEDATAVPAAASTATTVPAAPAPTATPVEVMEEMAPVKAGFTRVTLPPLDPPTIPDVELASDQTLVWYITGALPVSNAPYQEGSKGAMYMPWTYMSVFMFAPDGNKGFEDAKLRQGVAVAYDVSDDTKTYILHLAPDAVFTSGKPITAADVKLAWEFGAWPANQVTWGGSLIQLRQIKGFDAVETGDALEASGLVVVDDHTLQINLTKANAVFPLEMTGVNVGLYDATYAQDNPTDWQEHPVGVGPYQMTYDPTAGNKELTEADSPWPVAPLIKKVELPYISDEQVNLIAYEAGDSDVIEAFAQPALADPSHPLSGDRVQNAGGGGWYWGIDATLPPTDDINVRKALNHAIDMDAIAEALWGPGNFRPKGLIMSGVNCYNPANQGYAFEPDKAREFLAQSKYADDMPVIAITSRDFNPQMLGFMELAQASWKKELGIEVRIDLIEPGNPLPKPDQIKQASWGFANPDPAGTLSRLTLSGGASVIGRQGDRADDELDALMNAALELDFTDPGRCAAMQKVETLFMDRYYWAPWSMGFQFTSVVQPWVLGWKATWGKAAASLPFMQIGKRDRDLYK